MIPDLPDGIGVFEQLQFYDTLSGNLSDQSTIHKNWHTHRGNPSTCWICDQTTLLSKVLSIAFSYITKSTADMVTNEDQNVSDSEPEIENDNFDEITEDYNEPEYDVEDATKDSETQV